MSEPTAIPREINLGLQKPVATPAYTRRFKSQSSNPIVTNGSQCTITLDTAQPGSFIDTLSSYLSFKLVLTNASTTSGYNASFSACGAHALFRAMRIYVQGVPIEEITEYSALAEWLHDLAGIPDYNDRSAKGKYFANTMMGEQTIYLPPAATAGSPTVRTMNIQLPLISGVLGTMADKMFPSMLVAPGNCYIQLDVATAAHALRIMEVDLTGIIVGTAPVGNTVAPIDLVSTTAPRSTDDAALAQVSVFTGAGAGTIGQLGAAEILEYGPLDIPFNMDRTKTSGQDDYVGILTTEERIGGGMFYSSTQSYAGITVPTVCGNLAVTTGTDISTKSNLSNVPDTDANKLWLGGGVNANASTGGAAANRLTASSNIAVSFTINDLEYVGKQVVVGDDVARAIIERAAMGDISIHTQSYRQYPTSINVSNWSYQVDPVYDGLGAPSTPLTGYPLCNLYQRRGTAGSQSIVIPAKISSANAIYCIFRNGQSENNFWFDSLRRMTIGFKDQVGQGTAINAQLRIGNELIPQSPIQSASEAMEELLKAHHMNGAYGTGEKMGSIVAAASANVWNRSNGFQANRFSSAAGLTTGPGIVVGRLPFSDTDAALDNGGIVYNRNDWNSQILCPSPASVSFKFPTFASYSVTAAPTNRNFFAPLTTNAQGSAPTARTSSFAYDFYYSAHPYASQDYKTIQVAGASITATGYYPESALDYGNRQALWKDAVKRAFFGYADGRSDHQITDPVKPNFMNPFKQHTGRYSTFMLGFDLDTFSHNSDTVRSGHYLGNNTVSLNLSEFEVIDNTPLNIPLCSSVKMDTFILHDLRLSFQAGGIVQAFY